MDLNMMIEKLKNKEIDEGKGVIDNVGYKYYFYDYSKPLVITFDTKNKDNKIDKEQFLSKELNVWGYKFLKKSGFNVLSFTALKNGNYYRSKELENFLEDLGKYIDIFPKRIGYGVSMGGYGVSAYSNVLKMDEILLMMPISTLNKKIVPFEKRSQDCANNLNWEEGYIDGALTKSKGYVIYDPLLYLDAKHAKRYKTLKHLRLPGIGHAVPKFLLQLGILQDLVISFFKTGKIDEKYFYEKIRKRREFLRYYQWMLSKRNIYLTPCRKQVVLKYKYIFFIKNFKSLLNDEQYKILLNMFNDEKIGKITKKSKDRISFLRKLLKILSKKGYKEIYNKLYYKLKKMQKFKNKKL